MSREAEIAARVAQLERNALHKYQIRYRLEGESFTREILIDAKTSGDAERQLKNILGWQWSKVKSHSTHRFEGYRARPGSSKW